MSGHDVPGKEAPGNEEEYDVLDSEPGAPEAVGGVRDTSLTEAPEDAPPEQQPGNPEENPVGIPPKAASSRHNPKNPGHSGGTST